MIQQLQLRIQALRSSALPNYHSSAIRNEALVDCPHAQLVYLQSLEGSMDEYAHQVSNFMDQIYEMFESAVGNSQTAAAQLAECRRSRDEERKQNENQVGEMARKIEQMRMAVLQNQEQMRSMTVRIEERELAFEKGERETQEYLVRVEQDFKHHELALEEACTMVRTLQEQNSLLSVSNQRMSQTICELSEQKGGVLNISSNPSSSAKSSHNSLLGQNNGEYQDVPQATSEPGSVLRSESAGAHSLSVESRVEGSEEGEQVAREVLYLSREEVMKPWGWKCSVDNSKENHLANHDSGNSREKQAERGGKAYPHNRKESVGEFQLVTVENWSEKSCSVIKKTPSADVDPYRLHFKLVCQSAKINSGVLERVFSADQDHLWEWLTEQKVPIHQWQSFLIRHFHSPTLPTQY